MGILKTYKSYKESKFLERNNLYKENLYTSSNMYGLMYEHKKQGTVSFPIFENTEHFDKDELGGVITISSDVNISDSNKFRNKIHMWLSNNFDTLLNRMSKDKKVFKYLKSLDSMKEKGFTVGKFMKGSYVAKDGKTYDDKSFTVTIYGIDNDILNIIASGLAGLFKQEAVLVHSYVDNDTYLLYRNVKETRNNKIDNIIN